MTSTGDDKEKGNVTWSGHCGNCMEVPPKLKIELPYDLTVSLAAVYPAETKPYLEEPSRPRVPCSAIYDS